MIIIGVLLVVIGLLFGFPIMVTLGAIILVVGLILLLAGTVGGRQVGGRKHYW